MEEILFDEIYIQNVQNAQNSFWSEETIWRAPMDPQREALDYVTKPPKKFLRRHLLDIIVLLCLMSLLAAYLIHVYSSLSVTPPGR